MVEKLLLTIKVTFSESWMNVKSQTRNENIKRNMKKKSEIRIRKSIGMLTLVLISANVTKIFDCYLTSYCLQFA